MSKTIYLKLKETVENGLLINEIKKSKSITDIVIWLGYAKKGTTIKLVRDFLDFNKIEYNSFFIKNKEAHLEDRECPVCNKTFTVSKTNSKESKKVTCSYSCSNTYFRSGVNNPNWKYGGSYRERAIKEYGCSCQLCGFSNPLAIVVHHIDMDRKNNELENLIVLCANCHLIVHNGNYTEKP